MKVFSGPPDFEEPKVSGVGLNHEPNGGYYVVPPSYNARWDDEGYQFPESDALGLMHESPWEDKHGFIFHVRCYSLLQEFFHPKEVPLARLLEVCESIPFQNRGLDWEHDYGGIMDVNKNDRYLWDDQGIFNWMQQQLAHEPAEPWNDSDLETLLCTVQPRSPATHRRNLMNPIPVDTALSSHFFTKLPLELLENIVFYLHTSEVMALAQVSKVLAMKLPEGLGQLFWASRFLSPFEFDYIFGPQHLKGPRDWRTIYINVAKAMPCSKGLQNRKRIWKLIQSPLLDLICMRGNKNLGSSSWPLHEYAYGWRQVSGKLQPIRRYPRASEFNGGCRRFHLQRENMPKFCQVAASTISIGNVTYVTGVRFVSNGGQETTVGYTAGEIRSPGITDQVVHATEVHGFILAMGTRGIRALRFITGVDQLSQWIGCPDGMLRTHRLATPKAILALEAGFDVRFATFDIRHQFADMTR